jgi:hypothetical protein
MAYNFKKRETDPYAIGAPVYNKALALMGCIVGKNNKGYYKVHWEDGGVKYITYSSVILFADDLWEMVKDND